MTTTNVNTLKIPGDDVCDVVSLWGGRGWLGLLWSMWRGLFAVYIVLALGLAAVVGQRQVSGPRGIL